MCYYREWVAVVNDEAAKARGVGGESAHLLARSGGGAREKVSGTPKGKQKVLFNIDCRLLRLALVEHVVTRSQLIGLSTSRSPTLPRKS
ncbi:hypothetical protein ALC62_04237 [Cyphomyrmex costatus]|uniref:Uncharacterized protein n=1 Tax=Cyphomyrmex costatus TaxID=456900 RepID=A0A195CVZ3_9HYME|nr:hypothetical protein ALC62_04237 [Cyphomyrmex costatus]